MASASVQPSSPPAPQYSASPLAVTIPPHVCMIAKWSSLGLGGLLVLLAAALTSVHSAGLAAMGLFFTIASRIMQAEEHRAK